MKKFLIAALTIIVINGCTKKTSSQASLPSDNVTASTSENVNISEKESHDKEIKWLTYDEAAKLNAKSPKKIFVDVYTNWCGWCKRMDATTLKDPKITTYMNKKFYAVKLNAESDKKITYKGKEMTERELAAQVFKASGYPTTVYLDSDETLLTPVSGYLEVDILNKILHYYGEDYYKTTSWEQFNTFYSGE